MPRHRVVSSHYCALL